MEKKIVLYDPNNISDMELVKCCSDYDVPFTIPKSTRNKLLNSLYKRKPIIRKFSHDEIQPNDEKNRTK